MGIRTVHKSFGPRWITEKMITGIVSKFIPFSISKNKGRAKSLYSFALGRMGLMMSIGFMLVFYVLQRPDFVILFGGISVFIFLWPLIKRLIKLGFIFLAIYGLLKLLGTNALPI